MRVLVAGARGLLGTAITREFARDCDVLACTHADLDLTDEAAVLRVTAGARPDVIINCAALSGVDDAEDRAEQALTVNAFGVLALARAAAAQRCTLVHYSTDFVFDGEAGRPYREDDATNPRSFYGLSKLLGEWFASGHAGTYVLRVESLFGDSSPGVPPKGSVHTIVSQVLAGTEVPVFVDRTVSPSYTIDIARATRSILHKQLAPGVYHCVNTGAATWADVAREICRLLGRQGNLKPLTLERANLKAPRPRYCALSNARLASAGIAMPTWQDALTRHLESMAATK